MRYYIFCIFLLLGIPAASACPIFQPLTADEMNQAQSVFIGKAIDYKASAPPEPAKITFEVKNVVSGRQIKGQITVNWIHGTFGESQNLRKFKKKYGSLTKVGVLFPDTFPEKCEMREVKNGLGEPVGEHEFCQSLFIGSGKSEFAWVLNRHCSGPYMFPE